MNPIDVLAIIASVLVLTKIGVLVLIGPKTWMKVPQFLLKQKKATILVYYLAVLVSGYFLLKVLTLAELMAAVLFSALLIGVGLIQHYEGIVQMVQKSLPNRESVLKKFWLQIIVWVALAVLTLYHVFTQ